MVADRPTRLQRDVLVFEHAVASYLTRRLVTRIAVPALMVVRVGDHRRAEVVDVHGQEVE